MKRFTSTERIALLLLAAMLLLFLTVRLLMVASRDEVIVPEAVETVSDMPVVLLPDTAALSDSTTVRAHRSNRRYHKKAKSASPSSRQLRQRDHLAEPVN